MVLLWVAAVLAVFWLARALRPRRERDLRGKVVLLTGAGGGLGRFMSLGLARRGCRLACVDIATAPNEKTVSLVLEEKRQLQQTHVQQPVAKAYTADLSKREDITRVVKEVIDDFGCIDILVSNAGQLQGGSVWDLTEDQIDLVLDVNLRATLLLVRNVVPYMKARRSGHVVAVSSYAAVAPARCISVYGATKSGLSHYMDCLYHDLHIEGFTNRIHLTTVHPFFMATYSMLQHSVRLIGPLAKKLGMIKFFDPEECAEQVVRGIATRQGFVSIPGYIMPISVIFKMLPRRVQVFLNDNVPVAKNLPVLPYEYRHREMDAGMLHDLLAKGYPLDTDPEAVCQRLVDEHLARGEALPHDYAAHAARIQRHYQARGQAIPGAVRAVFGLST